MATTWPPRTVIRKSSGLRTLESALYRSGLGPVAGVDEVGRGACAGPLVVAACVLGPAKLESLAALDDSKKLTESVRERLFPVIRRYALAYHVVFIPPAEVDRRGVHVANIEGMRRAVAGLSLRPGYVLSDGFRVPGLAVPSLPVIGGDAVAACIAAASVLAKVSRDRLMVAMDAEHPGYGFADHKGTARRRTARRWPGWARARSIVIRSSTCGGWPTARAAGWWPTANRTYRCSATRAGEERWDGEGSVSEEGRLSR